MKRVLLLAWLGIAATSFGQGSVNWAALPPVWLTAQTNSTQYSPFYCGYPAPTGGGSVGYTASAISGLEYYYELLYNTSFYGSRVPIPDLASLLGNWHDTGLTGTNGIGIAGRSVRPVNPNPATSVPWAVDVTNAIVLVGWSANLGTSWAAVSNVLANWDYYSGGIQGQAFFGATATGYLTPNVYNGLPGPNVFGYAATPNGQPIYSLNTQLYLLPTAIPEPGVLAFAGLIGLSLVLIRHRRKNGGHA